jgi:hypothetical protein
MVSERKNYRTTFALTSDPVDNLVSVGVQMSEDVLCVVDQNQGIKSENLRENQRKATSCDAPFQLLSSQVTPERHISTGSIQ